MKKVAKAVEFIVVIIALVVGVYVGKTIGVESILRKGLEPVTLAKTEEGLPEECVGRPAADDIPRVEDMADWDEAWDYDYITIEPKNIVGTGVGVRYPWVSIYTRSRRGGQRRKADVINTKFDFFNEYGEYYLVQLPDDSYVLAEISLEDARKIKAGKSVALPVGRKQNSDHRVIPNIQELCDQYEVADTEKVFYCIDEQWNQKNNFKVLMIRLAVGAVVVLVLGTILIMIVDKIFKVKD